jgi:hypothetical protein
MLPSDELEKYVATAAGTRGIPVDPAWLPEIALHLGRLLEAARLLEQSKMTSQDLAPRFDP